MYSSHQEASRKEHPEASGIIGNHTEKPKETGLVLATVLFWGPVGCLGGCIFGWCTAVFDH